jgi:hypothetical protein
MMRNLAIQFGETVRSRHWLDAHPEKLQSLLRQHKEKDHPLCLCRRQGIPLYIAKKQKYYLAKMPGTGPQHALDCPLYEPELAHSGRRIYQHDAIIEQGEGVTNVKIDTPLGIRAQAPKSNQNNLSRKPNEEHKTHRAGIKLLGLLHLIWEKAGFNRWHPHMEGHRSYRQIYKFIQQASEAIIVQNQPLLSHLYVPLPFRSNNAALIESDTTTLLEQLLISPEGLQKRMLVIGMVKAFKYSKHGVGIKLAHAPFKYTFWMDTDTVQRYAQSYNPDLKKPKGDVLVFVIMTVEKTAYDNFKVVRIASMDTTRNFIPIDSSYEGRVCDQLIHEKRMFIKPLRYDAKRDEVFPDFLLLDAHTEPVPMEIYGYSSPEYNQRKIEKIVQYEKSRLPYWYWDTHIQPDFWPPFPVLNSARLT